VVDDLIKFGSLTLPMSEFLRACVLARLNIIVSGGNRQRQGRLCSMSFRISSRTMNGS